MILWLIVDTLNFKEIFRVALDRTAVQTNKPVNFYFCHIQLDDNEYSLLFGPLYVYVMYYNCTSILPANFHRSYEMFRYCRNVRNLWSQQRADEYDPAYPEWPFDVVTQ